METLLQDLRYGIRMLARRRWVSIVVILTLALGIGANTAIFSVVNAFVLRPLPYKEPEKLVIINSHNTRGGEYFFGSSFPDFNDWKDQNHVFEQLGVFTWSSGFNLTGGDEPEQIRASIVSSNLFRLLGVEPSLGRSFSPEEERAGAEKVMILSNKLWQNRFGSNPNIVGQRLKLDGDSFLVIGVMPQSFDFPSSAQLWVTTASQPEKNLSDRKHREFLVVGRLKPDVTISQAETEMKAIAGSLAESYPDTNNGVGVTISPLSGWTSSEAFPLLILLLGTVGFVLLVACANVANIQLAQAATRQKEIAVRVAVGASRLRIVRQLLTESIILALCGGAVALVLAQWGIALMTSAFAPPENTPFTIDLRVLSLTFVLSLITGLIFGIVPALEASRPNVNEVLKDGGSRGVGYRGSRFRSFLVVSEIALALVLLTGAGLMIKSFLNLKSIDLGFNPDKVWTMWIRLPAYKYPEPSQSQVFWQGVLERMEAHPGVESATATARVDLVRANENDPGFIIEGRQLERNTEAPLVTCQAISPKYFQTMGIPILSGRSFSANETEKEVAIISDNMARLCWPDENPIGKQIKVGGSNRPWLTIIGVARGVRLPAWFELTNLPLNIYIPLSQNPSTSLEFFIKAETEGKTLVTATRNAVWAVDKDQPISYIRTMEESIQQERFISRGVASLLAIFAAIGLILAMVGIYGVVSYAVTQRTHEIGIRIALGASSKDILRLVVGQGMNMALLGVGVGMVSSLLLVRIMIGLLADMGAGLDYGMSGTDPAIFATVSLFLICIALLACYIPARKATLVDPIIALRYE